MENIKELRDELLETLEQLKSNKITTKQAKEITNISGKIIQSSKVELDYNKYMNNKKVINFLEVEED